MKAFVTGGTGFIGSHLVEALSRMGIEVFALIRNPKKLKWLKGLNFHILKGDLFSIPSLPGNLDVVYHLAALTKATKAKDYYTVNQQGTASLFESLMLRGGSFADGQLAGEERHRELGRVFEAPALFS